MKILDISCGTSSHSIEFTKRGYHVCGIDLSDSQLQRAREKAAEQKLKIDFQKQDARQMPFSNESDLAIMLCEGSFPLMETNEMNFQILQSAAKALKPGHKLIFTTLNGLFPHFHSVKDFIQSITEEEKAVTTENSFDLLTFREHNTIFFEDDNGKHKELKCNERYYVPSKITWLFKSLNFVTIEIFGAVLGVLSRNNKLTTEDFEMLVIAVKS